MWGASSGTPGLFGFAPAPGPSPAPAPGLFGFAPAPGPAPAPASLFGFQAPAPAPAASNPFTSSWGLQPAAPAPAAPPVLDAEDAVLAKVATVLQKYAAYDAGPLAEVYRILMKYFKAAAGSPGGSYAFKARLRRGRRPSPRLLCPPRRRLLACSSSFAGRVAEPAIRGGPVRTAAAAHACRVGPRVLARRARRRRGRERPAYRPRGLCGLRRPRRAASAAGHAAPGVPRPRQGGGEGDCCFAPLLSLCRRRPAACLLQRS